jgi:hypothetical protein
MQGAILVVTSFATLSLIMVTLAIKLAIFRRCQRRRQEIRPPVSATSVVDSDKNIKLLTP